MEIRVPRSLIASHPLTGMLQRGVLCQACTPATVTQFVTEQLGWSPEYLRDRISTIFLDGKVVDDPDTATMVDGAVLGLSAAMPGLVGATLRRSGYYAAMRAQISWSADGAERPAAAVQGTVQVRLYNLILSEQADALLARGIIVDDGQLTDLVGESSAAALRVPDGGQCLLRVVDAPVQSRE